ncbi:hypothetical protein ILUMI_20993 [Ignelater luminosus]|uniref:Uncharacterized protein n=1 Tax=Ignelater luminosus TaxID=2038154 RepID=A0A8K0G420_IGNLU|nr:hypothetical protein ILUMI_20993 [Ignelater luminosus]
MPDRIRANLIFLKELCPMKQNIYVNTVLPLLVERSLGAILIAAAEFDSPLTGVESGMVMKRHLDKQSATLTTFKDHLAGKD